MKRAIRILVNATPAVSLALCVETLFLWNLSYRQLGRTYCQTARATYVASICRGEFGWESYRSFIVGRGALGSGVRWWSESFDPRYVSDDAASRIPSDRAPAAGFYFERAVRADGRSTVILIPIWLVVAVLGVPPAIVFGRDVRCRGRVRRAARGCCVECGYDCRATPERCPECGAVAMAEESRRSGPAG